MHRKKKGRVAGLLALVLVAMVLAAACSNNSGNSSSTDSGESQNTAAEKPAEQKPAEQKPADEAPAKEVSQPVDETLTFFWQHSDASKEFIVYDLIKELTGVTLVANGQARSSDNKNLVLSIASGAMPDIMFVNSPKLANQYGSQGAFLNILDYIDKMPNFEKWMKQYPEETKSVLSADGKMYIFPNQGFGELNRVGWLYREDIFRKNGLSLPANWDEFHEVLKELKKIYPDSIPFVWRDGLSRLTWMAPSFDTYTSVYYNFGAKEWRYGPIEDNFKKLVAYLHDFYEEGLISPDFLSMDAGTWVNTISTGTGFITPDSLARIGFFNEPNREIDPEYNLAFFPPPAGWVGGPQKNLNTMVLLGGNVIASTSTKKDAAIQFMDKFYSDEGRDLLTWGKEGVTYKTENGQRVFLPEYQGITNLSGKTGVLTDGNYTWVDSNVITQVSAEDVSKAIVEARQYDSEPQLAPAFNFFEQEVVNVSEAAITKAYQENIAKFILGTRDVSEWDEYVQEIKNLGLQDVLNSYTAAYNRMSK